MIDSGDPVTHVQDTLRRVAHANGVSAAGIVVMPTALIVSLPGEHDVTTSVTVAGVAALRLDQIDAVFAVADARRAGQDRAAGGPVPAAVRGQQPGADSRPSAGVGGHAVLSVGLAIIIGASAIDLAVAAVLGAAVGVARVASRRVTFAYQVFVPVLSAFTVAVVVFLLPRTGLSVGVLAPLIAPLVMFLPGALLTTSVIELATGQMVSGASRLAAGAMQLTFWLWASWSLRGWSGSRPAASLAKARTRSVTWRPGWASPCSGLAWSCIGAPAARPRAGSSWCCTSRTPARCWAASFSAARCPRSWGLC